MKGKWIYYVLVTVILILWNAIDLEDAPSHPVPVDQMAISKPPKEDLGGTTSIKEVLMQDPSNNISIIESERQTNRLDLEKLATKYLGEKSKITITAKNGTYQYGGLSDNNTHCQMRIMISSNEQGGKVTTKMKCIVNNPVLENTSFGAKESTLIVKTKDDSIDDTIYDGKNKMLISRKVYEALVTVLHYYAGNSDPASYTGDPLDGYKISHTFKIK
ncbi:hypothetical protein IJ096_03130 [Candidatus Saccharibacteria bacterium]|nr:hypothetical protein [Candidatus Saccharibacteria bacterium]